MLRLLSSAAVVLSMINVRMASLVLIATMAGCASLPPGSDFPRTASHALNDEGGTTLSHSAEAELARHREKSGFRLLSVGADGFLSRMQLAAAAERTLDVQYFILRSDRSGTLFTEALLAAADRGVRVRILIDDGETKSGDERIELLDAHPNVEVRVFNPFRYRGHVKAIRALEFMTSGDRLDYRMHNKLFVVDNAVALIGGRNIADEYFQVDPKTQFADDDLLSVGPVVRELSGKFDEFWNSEHAIPVAALTRKASPAALVDYRRELREHHDTRLPDGVDYADRIASGEPVRGMLSGRLPLSWASWMVVCDSPDKKAVEAGWRVGHLMEKPVAAAATAVQSELLMITPYLVPGADGMALLRTVRSRDARVRILTNSLESNTVPPAQAGYMRYRGPLLDTGIDLFEVRSLLGTTRGSGQTAEISRFGNFSLHGKMFVFDRRKIFIGSMNFDQRSMHLNTEIGLLIDSPELAGQLVSRFQAMTAPENAYRVEAVPRDPVGLPKLIWKTAEAGVPTLYDSEPSKSALQKLQVDLLTLLPIDSEL